MKFQLNKNTMETLTNFYNAMFSKEEIEKECHNEFLQMAKNNFKTDSIDSLILGLDYLIQKDLRNRLENLNVPILMIHGDEDSICPLEAAIYMKNRINTSHIEVLKNTGHIPFFASANQCYDIIFKFITKNIKKEDIYD